MTRPLLELLVALTAALSESDKVRQQAAAFVEQHTPALQRILEDANSLGVRCAPPLYETSIRVTKDILCHLYL